MSAVKVGGEGRGQDRGRGEGSSKIDDDDDDNYIFGILGCNVKVSTI